MARRFNAHGASRVATAAALALCASVASGKPYVPSSDGAILERLPAAGATRQLEPLRRAAERDPRDVQSVVQLARGYLQIGRQTSDPRFVSYAEATLAPLMRASEPPVPALVLQATALQSSHRFQDALAMLDRVLARERDNAQAWLTKATVLQVQGRFEEARTACRKLLQTSDRIVAMACIADVNSLTGRLAQSYEGLKRLAATSAAESPQVDGWLSGQLGEMAIRLGDLTSAEQHLANALRAQPDDVYLRAAYADLLLLQGRQQRVVELLRDSTAQDVLLLRLAIAARRAGAPDAQRWANAFDARRRAARAGDNPHLREHARFLLEVLDEPSEALAVARKNWEVQREPADVQLYLQTARKAGSPDDERIVRTWIEHTGYEDAATLP